MGELVFIGLGLYGAEDLSVAGIEAARGCDALFAEEYTSRLAEGALDELSESLGKNVARLTREQVEDGRAILEAASKGCVGFLVPGDPMTATTHVELRLQAQRRDIPCRIIHGPSILTAAAGLVGLQVYKFGRTASLPTPQDSHRPTSPLDVIEDNLQRGLHTLVLLDISEDGTPLTAEEAIRYLLSIASDGGRFSKDTLLVSLSQAGSAHPKLLAGPVSSLLDEDLGPPLHCLIVPGTLHFKEREALEAFAGLPSEWKG